MTAPVRHLLLAAPRVPLEFWHGAVEPLLERTMTEHNLVDTSEALFERVHAGNAQLWVLYDDANAVHAVLVTEIVEWPRGKAVNFVAFGAKTMAGVLECVPRIERWAKREGAAMIRFEGRDAWQRLYAPLGYERVAVVMQKEL